MVLKPNVELQAHTSFRITANKASTLMLHRAPFMNEYRNCRSVIQAIHRLLVPMMFVFSKRIAYHETCMKILKQW